jgi:hypothetical protein
MTTTAGHSFYIGPIGSFYNDTGSWDPLVLFQVNIFGSIYNSYLFFTSEANNCSGSHLGIPINIKNTKFVKNLPMIDAV